MSVSGVTSTLPVIEQRPAPVRESQDVSNEVINSGIEGTASEMDKVYAINEGGSSELIEEMARVTGEGQFVDVSI
jgi:hypothetical protein